ncbi:ATP-dependent DNA helicase [Neobacillus sp. D3-1R]|uniref:ATP-dependent DNA helicase n=1 Tax=Neobacillus sp. D3-1R TaxID=3445778 RepID=UPI003FA13477
MNILYSLVSFLFIVSNIFGKPIPTLEGINLKLNENELAFTFFSLSDGEATLIQHANGENILINTGAPGMKQELKKQLAVYHVDKISTIICTDIQTCTHDDLEWVITHFDVQQVIVHSGNEDFVKSQLQHQEDVSLHIWSNGTKQMLLPELIAEVVYAEDTKQRGMDISLSYFHHNIYLKNTFGKKSEEELFRKKGFPYRIVKLPYFGKEGSVSRKLLKNMDPEVAVLFHSKGKVPSVDLLKMLHEDWIDVYYTESHGNISIKFLKDNYEVITVPVSNDEE